jgi:uncharacterized protein involved in exopolysaccharide biosynthesis/Mrp family chromosome partitioning ATPase
MAPELHFQELVTILRRRRKMIIATAVIGTSLVLFGSLMIPPRYTAKSQIVFERQPIYQSDGKPVAEPLDEEAVLQTHLTALTSRAHLERAIDSLLQDPNFRAAASLAPRKSHSIGDVPWSGDVLWLELSARLREAATPLIPSAKPTEPTELRLDTFERLLNVYQEHGSHVIGVTFSSANPDQAALAANRVAELYIASEDARKRAQADRSLAWLHERIPLVKGQLEQAEAALQNYRIAHGLPDPNRADLSEQTLADLTRQLTTAESELAMRQAKLASVRKLQRKGSRIKGLVENLDPPAYAELLKREVEVRLSLADIAGTLGDNHPKARQLAAELQEVRRKLSDQADLAVDGLKNEVRIASDQVLSIRERLAGLQAANGQAREAEPRLRELVRKAAAAGQVYEGLLAHREQVSAQRAEMLPDLHMLSVAAPPDRPSSYSPLLFILPSLIVFSIGGGLLAITMERLDQGLRSGQDVNAAFGIPCMGFVPAIRRRGKARPHEYLLQNPFAAYAEAIRSVVAALQLAPEKVPKVILISSSVPNEGKTTLAVSFAVYTGLIGRRVLLVDLDYRHPCVLRELRGQAVADILEAGSLDGHSATAVQHFPGLNLDYLPMHGRSDDPLRAFVNGQVPRLLGQLRHSYDCIIVDSPPLLAVAEARLLAAMADKVLLVVKWGSTRREMARDASHMLRDLGLVGENCSGLVGAVLTQVDLKKCAPYWYGDRRSLRNMRALPPRIPRQAEAATSAGVRSAPSFTGLDTQDDRPPSAQTVPQQVAHGSRYRSRLAWRLWIGILLTLSLVGILFASTAVGRPMADALEPERTAARSSGAVAGPYLSAAEIAALLAPGSKLYSARPCQGIAAGRIYRAPGRGSYGTALMLTLGNPWK